MIKRTITIKIDEDVNNSISDILCWLRGYLAGAGNDYDYLLSPAIEKIGNFSIELAEKIKELEIIQKGEGKC